MTNKIEAALVDAIERYGPSGDGSYEYFGLIIRDLKITGTKMYRRPSSTSNEADLLRGYSNNRLFKDITRYAKIYDFSTRLDGKGKPYHRLVFAPFRNVSCDHGKFSELLKILNIGERESFFSEFIDFYRRIDHTGVSPLLKMGVEFDSSGAVREAKAYFAIKSYDDKYDDCGKRFFYRDCRFLVLEMLRLLSMDDGVGSFDRYAAEVEAIGYYPVFMGVNFSPEKTEPKMYFESCFVDYDAATIYQSQERLSEIMLGERETLSGANRWGADLGAFIDCFSYSIESGSGEPFIEIWKPYFALLNDRLISAKAMDRMYFDVSPGDNSTADSDAYKQVLVLDNNDMPVGYADKMYAHIHGIHHRAFSVFLHDGNGRMLIQRRAKTKYHSPSLLTNACCSHPLTNFVRDEAKVRLREELGITEAPELRELFTFRYCKDVGGGLTEHETDHVFAGVYNGSVNIVPQEADEVLFIEFGELEKMLENSPEEFTVWFRLTAKKVIRIIRETT